MRSTIRSTFLSLATAVSLFGLAAPTFASDWDVDSAHSRVGFSVKHMMVSTVRGTFDRYTGAIAIDDHDVTKSKAHLEIEAASIDTGNAKRDDHLRSPDFFDAAHFPKIVFDSTSVERRGDGLALTGNLTIRNITKPVVFTVASLSPEVKDPWGGVRRGTSAETKINRKDFGLTWNKALETGGVVVGDDVTISLDVELVKKKAQ